MAKYQGLTFVGIVEHITSKNPSSRYDYCIFDVGSGGMIGAANIEILGETVAYQFSDNFRQRITYEPPRGIDKIGIERGLCPKIYHPLSILEKDKFEKAVLNALKGDKK